MNLLTKTAPWVVASLLAATSAFGQSSKNQPPQKTFDQGHEMMSNQFMPAYNAPARIDVRGAWDFYAFGSFTYWQARQENMEVAFVQDSRSTFADVDGNYVNMNFKYKPGFKVGLGMNFDHDNWDACVLYTWYRGTDSMSTSTNGQSALVFPVVGHPEAFDVASYDFGTSSWKLAMDLLDVELARSSYSGMYLTVRPFFGARAGWIRQYLSAQYDGRQPQFANNNTFSATYKSYSWGIGPRAGLYSNWILGQGFRLYGNGAADILYTRYTNLSTDSVVVTNATEGDHVHTRQKDIDYLRTHMELELGIGWGSYFDNNNWHVDMSAGYIYQVFFNQNMFRHFTQETVSVRSAYGFVPNGDLFVHGLTASLRFDF